MLNNILNLGASALMNYQAAINVHSGNVANMGTEGYVRRTVDFETNDLALTQEFGFGMGVNIEGITRNFNSYLERQYLSQSTEASYWDSVSTSLQQIESLFNDVDDVGITSSLNDMFESFVELTSDSSNSALRTQTLSDVEQMTSMLNALSTDLEEHVDTTNAAIANQVDQANELITTIAELNKSLALQPENTALLDQRDLYARQLAELVDIETLTDDNGQLRVLTKEGQTLVDGDNAYSLRLDGPKSVTHLSPSSGFDGQVYFEGASTHEYTIEMASAGDVSSGAGAATFKVSLDGGKTFLTDENGDELVYSAGDADHKIEIDGVSIWFGTEDDPNTAPSTNLSEGDEFTVIPKTGLYWITSTGGAVNITPTDSNDNDANRLSGGSLAGLFAVRDQYVGEYQEELDAFTRSLVWETNYIHSQGAALNHYSQTLGEYTATYTDRPMEESGLEFADMLDEGNLSIALYNSDTGDNISVGTLNFSSVTPGQTNFDPSVHSLEDVRDAINSSFPGQLTASIQSGRLELEAADGVEFSFAGDSTGMLAALGINTLLTGSDAGNVAVDQDILTDHSMLNTATVNGSGVVSTGDNTTATALAQLANNTVTISTIRGDSSDTLSSYLNGLSASVGSDIENATYNHTYVETLADDLAERQESISGVNLDEEMTKIMQYQQNYEAAAKLIQAASEMFDTVLSLK